MFIFLYFRLFCAVDPESPQGALFWKLTRWNMLFDYLACCLAGLSLTVPLMQQKGGSKTTGGSRTAYCCLPYWTCCSLLQLAFTVATSCRAGRLTRVCQPLLQRIRYSGHLYDFWLLREDTPHFASLFCCLNSQSHLTVFAELSLLCDMLFIGVAPTLVSSNFLGCSN